jgi:hypothetical protein
MTVDAATAAAECGQTIRRAFAAVNAVDTGDRLTHRLCDR